MREYLPYEAHRKRISTHLQPFAGRRVFNLGTDAQYRHQKIINCKTPGKSVLFR